MKFFLLLLVIGCSHQVSEIQSKKIELTIFHTNDHHGHYLPDEKGQIGMSARKTLIDSERSAVEKRGDYSLLLSGGDINTGTMESDLFDAKPDFLGMRALGYDAMAVGNHEFDNDYSVIQKQMKWAGFPFLSANIFWKGTNKRVFNKPLYLVKNFDGIRVGIFGLTTKDTPFKASSEDAKKLFDFKDIIETAKEVVQILKVKEKVDHIIVVTHVGHKGSSTARGDVALAQNVDGIDVIVGGHSQEIINAEVHNGTIIVQAEDWGKYLGRLRLQIDKSSKKMLSYKLIPINLKKKSGQTYEFIEKEIPQDKDMIALFKPYKDKADKLGSKVIGQLRGELNGDRKYVRSRPTGVGQFVGTSVLDKLKSADIVVLNAGALRLGLPAGGITRKSLHKVHPYGNTIVSIKMNEHELFDYVKHVLNFGVTSSSDLYGGYPHFTNVEVIVRDGKLVSISELKGKWRIFLNDEGDVVSDKKEFIFATMNFLARGGDNYPRINDKKGYVDTGFMLNSAMMEYVAKHKIIKASKFNEMAEKSLKKVE